MLSQMHWEWEHFSSNQLLSPLEMLALRYVGVFEICVLFHWEFLVAWRCSLLILPNALFMLRAGHFNYTTPCLFILVMY